MNRELELERSRLFNLNIISYSGNIMIKQWAIGQKVFSIMERLWNLVHRDLSPCSRYRWYCLLRFYYKTVLYWMRGT